jgi:AbrB family looped-hinge helix DNA binding protein
MADTHARISKKGRTVIPEAVRKRLGLRSGDLIRFLVGDNGTVTIDKVRPAENDLFAGFREWMSEEDERLYAGL